nr:MAG TPA: hypothetical protein [Caudoviricetes sp.]
MVVGVFPVPVSSSATTARVLLPLQAGYFPRRGFIHFSRFIPCPSQMGAGRFKIDSVWAIRS